MSLLSQFLGPSHSLLLGYDHVTDAGLEEVREQLAYVGKYYRFSPLSYLVNTPARYRRKGLASIVLKEARKSIFLRLVPLLRELEIPFTVFLRTECLGTNRLPLRDEWRLYGEKQADAYAMNAWAEDPEQVRSKLRTERGALPVATGDPTLFYVTWGKIVELPSENIELGLTLESRDQVLNLDQTLRFAETMSKRPVRNAFSPVISDEVGECALRAGLLSVVTSRTGTVERTTSPYDLPLYELR